MEFKQIQEREKKMVEWMQWAMGMVMVEGYHVYNHEN